MAEGRRAAFVAGAGSCLGRAFARHGLELQGSVASEEDNAAAVVGLPVAATERD